MNAIINYNTYLILLNKVINKQYQSKDEFKNDLFVTFEIQSNPKADRTFNIAWQYGNSFGYHGVLNIFEDLVLLIK